MQQQPWSFHNETVWVTGAARGIGRQIATQLQVAGARVLGIDKQFAEETYPFDTALLDVRDPEQVAKKVQQWFSSGLAPGRLVLAAGLLRSGTVETLSLEAWQDTFAVNLFGAVYLLRELFPHFKETRGVSVVAISSNAARVPRLQMAAYCASKAALTSLCQNLALELAPTGGRCNVVSPGSTDTPMLRALWHEEDGREKTIAGAPDQFKLGIPLQKIATTTEVANAVLFLLSDLASHITMQDLVVDGGAILTA